MGGGSGGTPYATDITGMTGGRIIPGTNSTPNIISGANSYLGGGAGVIGGSYDVPQYEPTSGALISPISGGGGGGWGAAGGSVLAIGALLHIPVGSPVPVSIGGAGGKAINTNGHAVTWIGGASRAYGAIG